MLLRGARFGKSAVMEGRVTEGHTGYVTTDYERPWVTKGRVMENKQIETNSTKAADVHTESECMSEASIFEYSERQEGYESSSMVFVAVHRMRHKQVNA